jgi:hypothetical protein
MTRRTKQSLWVAAIIGGFFVVWAVLAWLKVLPWQG